MKVRVYSKDLKLICTANIKKSHGALLIHAGKIWHHEGGPEIFWEDFVEYVEKAFA